MSVFVTLKPILRERNADNGSGFIFTNEDLCYWH